MELTDINERYSQIDGFPDYYITESGRIFSKRLRGYEKSPKLHELKPKNPGKDNKYLNIILCNDRGQYTKSIHRLVAEYFVPGYFDGAVVNHIDGNNRNNSYDNLEWVTQNENIHKSYITSQKDQTRNYMIWDLFDPDGKLINSFVGHNQLEKYICDNHIDTSPSSLTRNGCSRGYTIQKYKTTLPEAVTTIP